MWGFFEVLARVGRAVTGRGRRHSADKVTPVADDDPRRDGLGGGKGDGQVSEQPKGN